MVFRHITRRCTRSWVCRCTTKGRSVGNLYLTNRIGGRPFTTDDRELVERFALHAGIAIENARLHEEIGRLAIVDERQRISQDLHDSIIQSLYAISLSLEDLPDVIEEDADRGRWREWTMRSTRFTPRSATSATSSWAFSRSCLPTTDLATGLRTLAAEFEANTMIDLELDVDGRPRRTRTETATHTCSPSPARRSATSLATPGPRARLTRTDGAGRRDCAW